MSGVNVMDLRPPKRCRPNTRQRRLWGAWLMEAQNGLCAHCEGPMLVDVDMTDPFAPSLDHVVPHSCGGANSITNMLLKHRACNEAAGARPPSRQDRKWQVIVREWLTAHGHWPHAAHAAEERAA